MVYHQGSLQKPAELLKHSCRDFHRSPAKMAVIFPDEQRHDESV